MSKARRDNETPLERSMRWKYTSPSRRLNGRAPPPRRRRSPRGSRRTSAGKGISSGNDRASRRRWSRSCRTSRAAPKPYHFPKKCPCPLKTDVVREVIAGGEEGARAALHRRVRLPVPAHRAPAAFRVAPRLRHRRLGREADRAVLRDGWVKEPADIFTLAKRDKRLKLERVEGYGETSVRNLFDAIEARRDHRARALGLCARHPPRRRDHRGALARGYGTWKAFREAAEGRQGRRGDQARIWTRSTRSARP